MSIQKSSIILEKYSMSISIWERNIFSLWLFSCEFKWLAIVIIKEFDSVFSINNIIMSVKKLLFKLIWYTLTIFLVEDNSELNKIT